MTLAQLRALIAALFLLVAAGLLTGVNPVSAIAASVLSAASAVFVAVDVLRKRDRQEVGR